MLIGFLKIFAPAVAKGLTIQEIGSDAIDVGMKIAKIAADLKLKPEHIKPKRCTIRAFRKKQTFYKGDMLQLYTGLCSKNCIKLAEVKCIGAQAIKVDTVNKRVYFGTSYEDRAKPIDKPKYSDVHALDGVISMLASMDGFSNTEEFYTFFATHPRNKDGVFEGQHIRW